jgi:hypothetical protein
MAHQHALRVLLCVLLRARALSLEQLRFIVDLYTIVPPLDDCQ